MFTHFLQVISIVFLQIEMVLVRLDSGSITVYYGLMKVHMCFQLCMLGFIEGRLLISKAILNKPLPTVVISNQICQIAFIQNTLVSYQNECYIKMRAAFLAPILPQVVKEGESKKATLMGYTGASQCINGGQR